MIQKVVIWQNTWDAASWKHPPSSPSTSMRHSTRSSTRSGNTGFVSRGRTLREADVLNRNRRAPTRLVSRGLDLFTQIDRDPLGAVADASFSKYFSRRGVGIPKCASPGLCHQATSHLAQRKTGSVLIRVAIGCTTPSFLLFTPICFNPPQRVARQLDQPCIAMQSYRIPRQYRNATWMANKMTLLSW
jgi:hypothetical protein